MLYIWIDLLFWIEDCVLERDKKKKKEWERGRDVGKEKE